MVVNDSASGNSTTNEGKILVFNGAAIIDRRYAIDWVQSKNGATFSGDSLDPSSYSA